MAEREAAVCQNCGALLTIAASKCQYCGAVPSPEASTSLGFDDIPALSSHVLGDGGTGLPLPVFPLLSGLWMISMDPEAQAVIVRGDEAGAKALVASVRAAGDRAADAGLDSFTIDLGAYTPDELWRIELARDLLAHLAATPGVARDKARLARTTVDDNNDRASNRAFAKARKELASPPPELAKLRQQVPSLTADDPGDEAKPKRHFWNRRS